MRGAAGPPGHWLRLDTSVFSPCGVGVLLGSVFIRFWRFFLWPVSRPARPGRERWRSGSCPHFDLSSSPLAAAAMAVIAAPAAARPAQVMVMTMLCFLLGIVVLLWLCLYKILEISPLACPSSGGIGWGCLPAHFTSDLTALSTILMPSFVIFISMGLSPCGVVYVVSVCIRFRRFCGSAVWRMAWLCPNLPDGGGGY